MKQFKLIVFALLVLAQWAIPGKMIGDKEKILRSGKVLKFQTAPIDPNDPLRGKYVYLSFKENRITFPSSETFQQGQDIYVELQIAASGYAIIKNIYMTKVKGSKLYVKAKIFTVSKQNGKQDISIEYPFNWFYMNEYIAPEAERLYRESNIDSTQKTYALVSVLDGDAVIRDVLINDTSIATLIKMHRK